MLFFEDNEEPENALLLQQIKKVLNYVQTHWEREILWGEELLEGTTQGVRFTKGLQILE